MLSFLTQLRASIAYSVLHCKCALRQSGSFSSFYTAIQCVEAMCDLLGRHEVINVNIVDGLHALWHAGRVSLRQIVLDLVVLDRCYGGALAGAQRACAR